jgi:hypothetical protein
MIDMPWWGWLITVVVALVALYYVVALVFFAKVSKRVFKTHDQITRRPGGLFGDKDPFDDPFFKQDHFGTTRKPHDRYL